VLFYCVYAAGTAVNQLRLNDVCEDGPRQTKTGKRILVSTGALLGWGAE
jgi:hypothetical protein